MYSGNDYRYYLENRLIHSNDFLAHYGVLGMHWGVRKAERYSKDTNRAKYNKEVSASKADYVEGKITKQQHKQNKKSAAAVRKQRNKKASEEIRKNTPKRQKGVKAKTIAQPYKNKAYREISNYDHKRAYRGLATGLTASTIPSTLATGIGVAAASPALGAAYFAAVPVATVLSAAVPTYVSRRAM